MIIHLKVKAPYTDVDIAPPIIIGALIQNIYLNLNNETMNFFTLIFKNLFNNFIHPMYLAVLLRYFF